MTQYLISFGAHAIGRPRRGRARRGQGRARGGPGGHDAARTCPHMENQPASIVATDGAVTDGPYPQAIGGFTLLDVPSREEALRWAAKIAVACRCAQEVRAIGADPGTRRDAPARLIAGGDVPAAPGRTRPAALEQDLPWRRPDNAGLSRGRGAAPLDRT